MADRNENRDVSEKIALGLLKGTGKLSGEALYDSRLFNQSSGMDAGFGAEDEYTAYSKPLFERGEGASSIYRPRQGEADMYGDAEAEIAKLTSTSRFKPDKGFRGAEGGAAGGQSVSRDAPVQFEKTKEVDPYDRNRGKDKGRDRSRSNSRNRDDRDSRVTKKARHYDSEDD
jgi:SNW domain-containing protein 1